MNGSQRQLDDQNLKELLVEYKSGNQTAQEQIIEICEPMVSRMARKYWSIAIKRNMSLEELKQEAYVGLLGAINHFQVKDSNSFISYAFSAMNYSMLMFIRNNSNLVVKGNYKKGFANFVGIDEKVNSRVDATYGDSIVDENQEDEFLKIEKFIDSKLLKKHIIFMLHDIFENDSQIDLLKDIYGLNGNEYSLTELCHKNNISLKELIFSERLMILQIRNSPLLESYFEKFDYHCKEAYRYGVKRFENTRTSSTEEIAMRMIEINEVRHEMMGVM